MGDPVAPEKCRADTEHAGAVGKFKLIHGVEVAALVRFRNSISHTRTGLGFALQTPRKNGTRPGRVIPRADLSATL